MEHLSPHAHPHDHRTTNSGNGYLRRLQTALWLNIVFFIIELFGGIYTHSTAILSDALHDFGDVLALGFALYAQKLSLRPPDKQYSYGYGRFSLLGALVTTMVLVVGSFIILREAIPHLTDPPAVHSGGVWLLALLGVAVNGAAVLNLRKGKTMNERVAMLHLFEDVLGWVAVLVGASLMWAFGWYWVDPLLAVLIAGYILVSALRNLSKSLKVLLQAVPKGIDEAVVRLSLQQTDGVEDVFDLHLWSLDGEYVIGTVHLLVSVDMATSEIGPLKTLLREQLLDLGVNHCTIEVEYAVE